MLRELASHAVEIGGFEKALPRVVLFQHDDARHAGDTFLLDPNTKRAAERRQLAVDRGGRRLVI